MSGQAQAAAAIVRGRAGDAAPRVGIILGSGLGGLAADIAEATTVSYADLPGFPTPGVEGHAGQLILGRLAGVPVACLQGRVHYYEGGPLGAVRVPVRTLKLLGCDTLFATNAAGSLNAAAGPGSLMMITDHINMLPGNPLVGENDGDFGPRFFAMDEAYDPGLRDFLRQAAAEAAVTLHEGVYIACQGPNFETPAEIRAFAALGADAVGMSTVPEVLVARHCGLRVAAVSVLTNLAAGLGDEALSHEQTLKYAAEAARDMSALLLAFLRALEA
ncbi:MAG: purine-nucleoside phosphorylase [Alphaproteobacteria bacterium]|jgi:xanthosine phosphorylase|nr:purine-nucleoside phosphorylase [Alphaproteobacteria bacterium]MDP6269421.1 purine-nucleoside phosphorylase [Alphaproteobacteria bacterium]MDP7427580.1 purine-nucleoside phosphorylase [Alphaproteobacteria bacterium]